MKPTLRTLSLATALSMMTACSFHGTATHWNGRVGPDGHPVFVKTATNVAINLLILLPFLGNTSMDEMINDITAQVATAGGDHIRVIESSSTNYWDAIPVPPITFFVTPVVSNLAVEYRPSPAEMQKMMTENAAFKRSQEDRQQRDDDPLATDANARR